MERDEFEQRLTEGLARERRARRRLGVVTGGLLVALLGVGMGPVAANHLNVKTSDIRKGAVTTPKIKKQAVKASRIAQGAVRTPKIANGAVKTPKIAAGAVTTGKLAPQVDGVALAGVRVGIQPLTLAPLATTSFNRVGGDATVLGQGVGVYQVTVPGAALTGAASYQVTPTTVSVQTNINPPQFDTFRNRHCSAIPSSGGLRVRCYDSDGAPAHMGFQVVIFNA